MPAACDLHHLLRVNFPKRKQVSSPQNASLGSSNTRYRFYRKRGAAAPEQAQISLMSRARTIGSCSLRVKLPAGTAGSFAKASSRTRREHVEYV
jgi:hypothetical protein